MKTLIFSLDTKDRKPSQDEYNTMKTHLLTAKIIVNNAKGSYKGEEENGFICLVATPLQEEMVKAIAHAYKQESILEIEMPSLKAYMHYLDSDLDKYVGQWKEASATVTGDFTLNVENMKVYQCVLDSTSDM